MSEDLELALRAAGVLFANAETTERTLAAARAVASASGQNLTVAARWDGVEARIADGGAPVLEIAAVAPTAIDMNKVVAAEKLIQAIGDGRIGLDAARAAIARIAAYPPVGLGRFVVAAAVGAAALGVIFGAREPSTFALVAVSAGAGALVRRALASAGATAVAQPFAAALVAGAIAGLAQRLGVNSPLGLVALCPCLVLVPGPHFLNGFLDLARLRVGLGGARIAYAGLLVTAICAGLLTGLALVGGDLPIAAPARAIPFWTDLVATVFAVAAYGSFYSMPWRYVPIPVVAGTIAHSIHWLLVALGASAHASTFAACLFVGLSMTPLARRVRLPFAAISFAAVVALIPGAALIRMAAAMLQVAALGASAPPSATSILLADAATALFVLVAMGFGLVFPKLWSRPAHEGHA